MNFCTTEGLYVLIIGGIINHFLRLAGEKSPLHINPLTVKSPFLA